MPRTPPPEKYRFTPGQSGNPGGRPKGTVNLTARIRKVLEREQKDGRKIADVLADVLVKETLKNPAKMGAFLRDFIDRDEGKVSDRLEVMARPLDLVELLTQIEVELTATPDDCQTDVNGSARR